MPKAKPQRTPEQHAAAKRWTDAVDNMIKSGIWPEKDQFRRKRSLKAEPAESVERRPLEALGRLNALRGLSILQRDRPPKPK